MALSSSLGQHAQRWSTMSVLVMPWRQLLLYRFHFTRKCPHSSSEASSSSSGRGIWEGFGLCFPNLWTISICASRRRMRSSWLGMPSSVENVQPGTSQAIGGGGVILSKLRSSEPVGWLISLVAFIGCRPVLPPGNLFRMLPRSFLLATFVGCHLDPSSSAGLQAQAGFQLLSCHREVASWLGIYYQG